MYYPLMFDPGEDFAYGIGIDWVGRVVEQVDGRTIDRFCREEIFAPLDMTSTRFEPDDAVAPVKVRAATGHFHDGEFPGPPSRPEVYGIGSALYSTAGDYIRFLRMILARGELDGRRVLSGKTADLMLSNQIGGIRVPAMTSGLPAISADVDVFSGIPKTWTAGFMRVEEDVPGLRRAGSVGWAGILNTHCWLDGAQGIAGVFMTQQLPFCEPRSLAAFAEFERAVYAGC